MTRPLYFAYGSNLSVEQMAARCPAARPVALGYVRGYRLAFAGCSRTWGGGVATLVAHDGEWVEGLIYRMTWADLFALDRCEGHPWVYQREHLLIGEDDRKRRRRAWVYIKPVHFEIPPSREYLGLIQTAYRRFNFDPAPLFR